MAFQTKGAFKNAYKPRSTHILEVNSQLFVPSVLVGQWHVIACRPFRDEFYSVPQHSGQVGPKVETQMDDVKISAC